MWRRCQVAGYAVLAPLTASYLVLACMTVGRCYVQPCYEGWGLDELWKVNKGVGVAGVCGGAVALGHALAGALCFGCRPPDESARFVLGAFAGASLAVALSMLGQAAMWTAMWHLLYGLSHISQGEGILYESGRHMFVEAWLRTRCRSLALLAAHCCLVELLLVVGLAAHHRRVVSHFKLAGGADPSETTRFNVGYQLVDGAEGGVK